jgi:hypothetical protein
MQTQIETPIARPKLRRAEQVVVWVLPSLADALFVLCLFGIVFVLQGRALGQDGDIGWHIRLGLRTLSADFPRTDAFSSAAFGKPLVGMEWLAEVCYAAMWRLAGLNGVVVLAGVLVAGTTAGLLIAMRARGTPLLLALPLTLLAVALTSIHWVARPHLFSLPLTLWWSEWLWRYWRDGQRRRLWYFPAVMVLWVNLHGGFLTGALLLGTATAVAWLFPHDRGRSEPRALTGAFVATLLATALTPWGPSWVGYFAAYFTDPLVVAHTQELQSPDFHTLVGRLLLAMLLALAATWIFSGRGRALPGSSSDVPGIAHLRTKLVGSPEPLAWATAGLWTVLALTAIRAVPLWAIIVTPLLGEALTRWLRELAAPGSSGFPSRMGRGATWVVNRSAGLHDTERQIARGLWSALALGVIAFVLASGGRLPATRLQVLDVQFSPRDFPVAAVAELQRTGLPPGRGFNTVEWGGYLIYALPEYHVFIDSRSDFYGRAMLTDYLTVMDVAPGWQRVFDRYQIRWTLLPTATPLARVLALTPGWSCAPEDDDGVALLCVRGSAGPRSA